MPTGTPSYRDLPATVWALVLARAANRLGAFTLPFLAVTLVQEFGATVAEAGYLFAAFGAATIPSRLFGGRLADRLGAKVTIAGGLGATAAAQLLVAAAPTLGVVAVAVVLLGLAFEIYEPPSQALIADSTPPAQHTQAYGLLAAAMAAAGMGAGLLAALVAGWDLRLLFVVDAATCLVCAAAVTLLLPRRDASRRVGTGGAAPARPWADTGLLALVAAGTVFAVIYLQITIALPLTLTARGLPPAAMGILLTTSAATIIAAQPLLTRVRALARADHHTAMAAGYVLVAAGLFLYARADTLLVFTVTTVLWSVGDAVLLGRAYALVAAVAPPDARGRYLAVYGVSWGLAAVVAPLAGTQLLARWGPGAAWTTLAVASLALALAQPALRSHLERSGPRAGTPAASGNPLA
ncbi:MFS transporter [uncultured Phycicoccus sp.]|uniref:MFS transporter n=1 Tax=uncultured Phycicoccus sp. TaxID=661422 RepID=UPI0026320548|nr:MFS transporter [uncultured Phycicoccus sp.]